MSNLKEVLEKHEIIFEDGDINQDALYKLWTTGEIFDTENSSLLELYYIGLYYNYVKVNPELMKKYYLMAIERGDLEAMNDLGYYYHFREFNPELMKKYYLMAIERGYSDSMNNLGHYYDITEVNIELMMQYYLMAIDRGNSLAMFNLGHYYQHTEKNPELMKKYYLMAIEKGDSDAMYNLTEYYTNNFDCQYTEAILYFYKIKNYETWINSWEKVFCKNLNVTPELIEHLTNIEDEHVQMLPKFIQSYTKLAKEKIDILELHFKYAPGAVGYEECKINFYKSISN